MDQEVKPRKLPNILNGIQDKTERNTLKKAKERAIKNSNKLVTQPIARMDGSILKTGKRKSGAGRKKLYTPTRLKNSINSYFDWCEENDRVPSIKGLIIHLKMYRDTFYKYKEYPEFSDIIEHARLIISEWCESDVYRTPGAAAAKIAYMKNIHDWTEKMDSNTTVTKITTVDEARARIEMLAPKLLEVLKNNGEVVNQLLPPAKQEVVVDAVEDEEEVDSRRLQKTSLEASRKP